MLRDIYARDVDGVVLPNFFTGSSAALMVTLEGSPTPWAYWGIRCVLVHPQCVVFGPSDVVIPDQALVQARSQGILREHCSRGCREYTPKGRAMVSESSLLTFNVLKLSGHASILCPNHSNSLTDSL